MIKELMFDIIPLSRYNHLVGNGVSKVLAKFTSQTAVPWTTIMECPMSGPGLPGCNCPITILTDKEMFMAHCQIYHIDQHSSCIVFEHRREGVFCQYMTDHEADMKQHIHKVHEPALKAKLDTNWYLKENAWLDLTSSWSINDIERRFKTLPERHIGSSFELLVWIIDHSVEDPNVFRVPLYASADWHIMLSHGKYTIKDM